MYYIVGDSIHNVTNPIHKLDTKPKNIPFYLQSLFANKYTLFRVWIFTIKDYFFTAILLLSALATMIYGYFYMPTWFDNTKSVTGSYFFKVGSILRRPLPVFLFALIIPLPQNNISLLSLIGTTYQDVLVFHKISGLLFGGFAVLHSICDLAACLLCGFKLSPPSYKNGVLCFSFVLLLLAAIFIRRWSYNIFHKIHVIAFGCIVGTYILHIDAYTKDFYYYLLPPLVLYLFDVLLRITHICVPGEIISKKTTPSGITILTFTKNVFYNPTQFIQILIPKLSPWSFHPFSILCGNFRELVQQGNPTLSFSTSPSVEKLIETPINTETQLKTSIMKLVIAPLGVWTTMLTNTREKELLNTPIFTTCPVGRPICPLGNFGKILLVGSGVGFCPSFGHLQALCIDGIHDVDWVLVAKSNELEVEFEEDIVAAKSRTLGNFEAYCTRDVLPCKGNMNGIMEFKQGRPNFVEVAERYEGMKDVLVLCWGSRMMKNTFEKSFRNVRGVHFTVYIETGEL
ncbi:hypothetical protein EIN_372010 [Entamoeba invadens IP1]|uniref:Ferric oxidoreductase domain-containing protein n=1 Tax=Entamoeba invadens IP1 TaxID=370355 RepID=A0A0A1UFM9_ENTIV|nr:hypothetical protein EIN_372010 [Entamoeba invadens IP1]ELP92779.1 hypothetical protein EIN_372010 [Entamoeba invadens IP1]|eukprot:XP_004259550.1 hypothetical protein EIN_372010 [Entamoeba invadens IP1]